MKNGLILLCVKTNKFYKSRGRFAVYWLES